MTCDRPSKTPNARPSTTASAPRTAARSPRTLSDVRSSTPPTKSTFQKGGQVTKINATATDNKGDAVTPMRAFLSSNITPRSGSRRARVESASSTPRSTPESTLPTARPVSMIEGRDWPFEGPEAARELGTKRGDASRPARAQSVVSDVQHPTWSSPADDHSNNGLRTANPDSLPKFFHANDAKPSCSTRPQSQSPRLQPRLAGLDYTNGMSNVNTSAASASPEPGDERPKFFHADGTEPGSPPTPRVVNGVFSARPPLQTIFSSYQTTHSPVQRPPSPLKEEVLPIPRKSSLSKPSPRRHTRLVSSGSNDIRAPDTLAKGQFNISRRSSLNDSSKRVSQPQSPSTASFGFISSQRSSLALSDSGRKSTPVMPPDPTYAEMSLTEPASTSSPELLQSGSPSKPAPGQSKLDHLNELAANARRERKVLDLEISNSSLLAINRTLEVEMRKQKAELRYLRRLRSSSRFPSSTLSVSSRFSMPSAGDDLSPTSSADEDEVDDDRFSSISSGTSDDTSFPDSLSFSPTLRSSSIPVAKTQRNRSLKISLSAQRVLLLDSQKLNQALKRCLGRTDELIADGRKALDYKVNTGDVASLGPRVLTPEERDEELDMGRGLLSPGLNEHAVNPWERTRKVGDTWNTPQPASSEGLMLEIPMSTYQHQASNGNDVRNEQALPEANPTNNVHVLPKDPEIDNKTEIPGREEVGMALVDAKPLSETRTQEQLEIPYEDPGIDTESETPPSQDGKERATRFWKSMDDQVNPTEHPQDGLAQTEYGNTMSAMDSSRIEPSSGENSEVEEPRISSPGKGLGDFLRMVGGSWGV
ncbi:MAG: hypothetical protein Q9225_003098 [Loekoesia sp. 1 TL-2023]